MARPIETSILSGDPACNPICRVCHYKDLDYPAQLLRKQRWAESQLGSWKSALQTIIPAPPSERLAYRAKTWLRANVVDGSLSFGMFRAIPVGQKWGKQFVSWDTCPMHIEGIQATLPKLREALYRAAPEKIAESLFGVWIGGPHLVVIAKESLTTELRTIDWAKVLSEPLRQVWFHQTNQVGRSTFGEGPIVPIFGETVPVSTPIRAFRQISQTLLEQARTLAVAALLAESPSLVLDLYCGTGEIAHRLPANVGWIGIEASKDASAFAGALRVDGEVTHAAFTGFVEHRLRDAKVLARIPDSYSLYINPPRPGLGEAGQELVLNLIRAKRPNKVVYLSCSASSLARDLRALESVGVVVSRLLPFDFFPQTEHFETLAILKT